jgi:hypothetical protein
MSKINKEDDDLQKQLREMRNMVSVLTNTLSGIQDQIKDMGIDVPVPEDQDDEEDTNKNVI